MIIMAIINGSGQIVNYSLSISWDGFQSFSPPKWSRDQLSLSHVGRTNAIMKGLHILVHEFVS